MLLESFRDTFQANYHGKVDILCVAGEDLPNNTRFSSCKTWVEVLAESMKGELKEQMELLRESVRQQKEELQQWWHGSSAAELLDFPKKIEELETQDEIKPN